MNKFLGIISLLAAISTSLICPDAAQAGEDRILCDTTGAAPMTILETDGQRRGLIIWRSQDWSRKGLSAVLKCFLSSQALNNLVQSEESFQIGTGRTNGQNMICALDKSQRLAGLYVCDTPILTMEPYDNVTLVFQQFLATNVRRNKMDC